MTSRAALLAGANVIYAHLRLFRLLIHVGSPGKKSKTGDTSDLVLDCGSTASFTQSFVYSARSFTSLSRKRRFVAQCAAEVAQRRALFDGTLAVPTP